MRRHASVPRADIVRIPSTFSRILTAAVAAALLATAFVQYARAETRDSACPDGLMRRSEAGTGMLLLDSSVPGCYLPAPRVAADIAVDISGPIARTKVTQRFENPANGWVEGVYVFPLPETAAVDTLKMKIGDRLIEGLIKERQEARRVYEAAKAEGKKTSLVEEERPNIFTNNVANIGPHEIIVVQIEYQESLRFDASRYHLRVPLLVAPRFSPPPSALLVQYDPRGPEFRLSDPVPDRSRLDSPIVRPDFGPINPASLTVQLHAGFPLGAIVSASHKISIVRNGDGDASIGLTDGEVPTDRDFTLDFAAAPGATPSVSLLKETSGGSDYFLALVVPPAHDAAPIVKPREAIFILDNSGSMAGESIKQAKVGLLLALDRLTPADRFNVIRFDDTMTMLFPASVDATAQNLAYAKFYVSNIEARGGTVMLPALLAALADRTPDDTTHLRQVIFLTDGSVGNEAELFNAIDERIGRSRLFTIGIGSAPNAYFMSGAARAGRGTYTYIGAADQVAPKMSELFVKLERPVMTEVSAQWPDGVDGEAWPNPLPDLYDGEPIVLTLKASKADGTLTLSGNLAGSPWRAVLDLAKADSAKGIEKLWARNKIAALDESRVRGVDGASIDKAVLEVALDHHLVSRLTSLVAVDVTPSRPDGAGLNTGSVPLNLPDGWDFGKVFGESAPAGVNHANAAPAPAPAPAPALAKLALAKTPDAAVKPGDAGLVLPQGGTESDLLMLAGLALLIAAGALLLRERRLGANR